MSIFESQGNTVRRNQELGLSEDDMEDKDLSTQDVRIFSDGSGALTEDYSTADADIKEVDCQSVVETNKKADDENTDNNDDNGSSNVELNLHSADSMFVSMATDDCGTMTKEADTKTVKPRSGVSGSLSKSAKSDGSTRRSLSNINRMLPQPFALGTDRRSPSVGKAIADTTLQKLPQSHYLNGKVIGKDTQVNSKTGPRSLKPLNDEKTKKSRTSTKNSCGFNFKCEERAEKRKQFYTKLEEIHNAKEEEKIQIQAKTKEEMETEIRLLRKSLTFKANPIPTFYQEGTPPKAELKKIPTTRAKSPKFGRRNSPVTEGLNRGLQSSNRRSTSAGISSEIENGRSPVPTRRSMSVVESSHRISVVSKEGNAGKGKKNGMESLKKNVCSSSTRSQSENLSIKATESDPENNGVSGIMGTSQETATEDNGKVIDVAEKMVSISINSLENIRVQEKSEESIEPPNAEHIGAISMDACEDSIASETKSCHMTSIQMDDIESATHHQVAPNALSVSSHSDEEVTSEVFAVSELSNAFIEVHSPVVRESSTSQYGTPKGIESSLKSVEKSDLKRGLDGILSNNGKSCQPPKEEKNATQNRTVRREKLKASTPLFRKKQDVQQ